jgi:hypothetical protein
MAEMDLGYFGDERLKKMARGCCGVLRIDRRSVCESSETIGPKK